MLTVEDARHRVDHNAGPGACGDEIDPPVMVAHAMGQRRLRRAPDQHHRTGIEQHRVAGQDILHQGIGKAGSARGQGRGVERAELGIHPDRRSGHDRGRPVRQMRQSPRQTMWQPDIVLIGQGDRDVRQVAPGEKGQIICRAAHLRPLDQAHPAGMADAEGLEDRRRRILRAIVRGPKHPVHPVLRLEGGELGRQMGRAVACAHQDEDGRRHAGWRPDGRSVLGPFDVG
nr:hypothetical protein [Rubellimicrobium thermophilum]